MTATSEKVIVRRETPRGCRGARPPRPSCPRPPCRGRSLLLLLPPPLRFARGHLVDLHQRDLVGAPLDAKRTRALLNHPLAHVLPLQAHRDRAVGAQQPELLALPQHPEPPVVGAEELRHLLRRAVPPDAVGRGATAAAASRTAALSFSFSAPAVVLVAGPSVFLRGSRLVRLGLFLLAHPHARVHLGAYDGHGRQVPGLEPPALDLVQRVLKRPAAPRKVREDLAVGVEDVAGSEARGGQGVRPAVAPHGLLRLFLLLRLPLLLVATHRSACPESVGTRSLGAVKSLPSKQSAGPGDR